MKKLYTPADLCAFQWKAFKFAWYRYGCALFLEMGLGKTIIVLSWIKALLHKGRARKPALIVAPIRVMYNVWPKEAEQWSHTRSLQFSIVHGSIDQRIAALGAPADVYLINPENLVWLLRLFKGKRARKDWPFDILVIDESSMFKAAGSKRFGALRYVVKFFKYRIILSGTPTPNSLLEIWPQMYIVDMGKRLGDTYGNFKNRFSFDPSDPDDDKHAKPVMRNGAEERIHRLIRDAALSMELSDENVQRDFRKMGRVLHDEVPPNDIYVDLPPAARRVYDKFEEEMFIELDQGDVNAFNPATLCGKCHQIANGAIYSIDRVTENKIWEPIHSAKLDALLEIVNETGTPVLIPYWFKHDLARIMKILPGIPHFNPKNVLTLEDEWNSNVYHEVAAHPLAVSHGANLQYGKGHTFAWYSLTYSWERYIQLYRRMSGARAQQLVMNHRIIARNTVDEAIVKALNAKAKGSKQFMAALKQYKLERTGMR